MTEGEQFCPGCGVPVQKQSQIQPAEQQQVKEPQAKETQDVSEPKGKKKAVILAVAAAALVLIAAISGGTAIFLKNRDGQSQEKTRKEISNKTQESNDRGVEEDLEREPEQTENGETQAAEPAWASLVPAYSVADMPSIDIYASNYAPGRKAQGAVWDSTLFYWLEDVDQNSAEDGYLMNCPITKTWFRNAASGNPVEYEIYRDPWTGEIYKIVSIERTGEELQLVDYYYQGGIPNFAFSRTDSSYTPTYATPSKTGERYYFNQDVMVRWRQVHEPGRIQECVLTSSKVPYTQTNYYNVSDEERALYDQTELRMLNAARNTYDAVSGAESLGMLEGNVEDTTGAALEGVTVDVLDEADGSLLYRGITASDGSFRILTYLDDRRCNVVFRETDLYRENAIYGMTLSQSDSGSCGTVLMHRIDGDEYPVSIKVYSASDLRSGEDGQRSGNALADAQVRLRAGAGARNGEVIQELGTDADGTVTATLPSGTYTAQIDAPGYAALYLTVEVADRETAAEGYLLPAVSEGQIGVVMTWEGTADLDLTLFTPYQSTGGDMAHIGGAVSTDASGSYLVADNMSGCEVMYVNTAAPGNYKLYVNDYTHSQAGDYSSGAMAEMNIHIYLYDSTGLIGEYLFPTEQGGVLWEVLDISGGVPTPAERVYSSLAGKTWWQESKDAAARNSWLNVKGLEISPQGSYTFWFGNSAYQDFTMEITETTKGEGIPDGFKQVTAKVIWGASGGPGWNQEDQEKYGVLEDDGSYHILMWTGTLDRYTG